MHEASIALSLVSLIEETVRAESASRALSAANGTIADGARLDLIRPPGQAACMGCGARVENAARLSGVADLIVSHDRKILVRADDPVARVIDGAPVYLRRGRGCVPEPILLPQAIPPTIAFGAHLKAAVCVTRGREAFIAQHVGDLDDPATRRFHAETAAHLTAMLAIKPERAACDLHPDFASTRAAEASGLPLVRVQHHHAHALACAAAHGLQGPFLALVLDGFGRGPHGEAWGGELLRV